MLTVILAAITGAVRSTHLARGKTLAVHFYAIGFFTCTSCLLTFY